MSFEMVRRFQTFSDNSMIVDLSIDSKGKAPIQISEGLSSTVYTRLAEAPNIDRVQLTDADNAKTLVC